MKRIYVSILAFTALLIFAGVGCKKNQDITSNEGVVSFSAEGLSKDATFIELNDAMNRFDPKYLQLVFHDGRSTEELIKKSESLIQQLSLYPDQPAFQKAMADFYHFSSVDQLKLYSGKIRENLNRLYQRPEWKQKLFSEKGGLFFFQARTQYAKHKMESSQNGDVRRQTNSLWNEMVDTYLSDFGYISVVYDEGLMPTDDLGGGDPCHGEKCCLEQSICLSNAKKEFWNNFAIYGGSAATSLGTSGAVMGFKAGTFLGPEFGFIGGLAGALWGGAVGGASGAIIAYNIYSASKDICKSKYNQCINSGK